MDELELLVKDYGTGYFDAFHLTAHAMSHAMSDGTEPKEMPEPDRTVPLQA